MSRYLALGLCIAGGVFVWFTPNGDFGGWVRSLALVVFAGVGALIAGRGPWRRAVALIVMLTGLGMTIGGAVLTILSGIVVAIGGMIALVTCKDWPVMGPRYERAARTERTDLWHALDRGEDPTI